MYYESRGYKRIGSKPRITEINSSTCKGIDAIYVNLNPPPKFLIVEVKFNKAKLGTTKHTGAQGSDDWLKLRDKTVGKDDKGKVINRLEAYLDDKGLAKEIEAGLITGDTIKVLTRVKIDGFRSKETNPGDTISDEYSGIKFTHKKIDKDGDEINELYEIQNFRGEK